MAAMLTEESLAREIQHQLIGVAENLQFLSQQIVYTLFRIFRKIVFQEDDIGEELYLSESEDAAFDNLNRSFYLMYGVGHERAAQSLTSHSYGFVGTPEVSKGKVNLASGEDDFGTDTVRPALTRLHGILMWVAWPVLACTGIFFALWMRPVLPNGEWFQVHRALMLSSLVVASLGIVVIFASQYRSKPMRWIVNFKDGVRGLYIFLVSLHGNRLLISS